MSGSGSSQATLEIGETTMDLLEAHLPGISSPVKGYVDEEEDEVFFGKQTERETGTQKAKYLRKLRRTLCDVSPDTFMANPAAYVSISEEDVSDKENAENGQDCADEEFEICSIGLKDLNVKAPTPSPRKFNTYTIDSPTPKARTKLNTPTDSKPFKEIKSASKLLSHLPKTTHNEDEETDEENSILDVNNDQLFDDSIFTEYDENNLSCMSKKLAKSWKQQVRSERRKTGNFVEAPSITSMVSEKSSDSTTNFVPETPCLSLDEIRSQTESREASRRESSASTFSDWFNTSREEKILYEKYGEDYDEIVEKMSRSEKMKLKADVAKVEPKDAYQLLASSEALTESIHEEMNDDESATTSTHSFIKAKHQESIFEPPMNDSVSVRSEDIKIKAGRQTPKDTVSAPTMANFKTPTLPRITVPVINSNATNTLPSYLRPTTASRLKASPSKYDSPAAAHQAGNSCPRIFSQPLDRGSGAELSARRAVGAGIDMKNIVSPVSQYIRANPAPPLVRTIRPKASRFLGEELKGEEVEKPVFATPQRYFAPLPERQYFSTKVALEQKMEPKVEHKELPKAFGTVNTVQAVVVRHVGRMRVPKTIANSDLASYSPPTTPHAVGTARLTKRPTPRESIPSDNTMDESTMEMSIREYREIKKLTTLSNLPEKL